MKTVRRKCFISYHHADQEEVDLFIRTFDHQYDVFIARGLGEEMSQDIINSTNTAYVMTRIRDLYLKGSSVTIVLMGRSTWARRYVDWEIQSSLRGGAERVPNGLLGIQLPSFSYGKGIFPDRLNLNLIQPGQLGQECYARWMDYPTNLAELETQIEAAYQRRETHRFYIKNPRERMEHNRADSQTALTWPSDQAGRR